MKKNTIIMMIIAVVIVGAGSFFGGMKYQQSKQPSFMRQAGRLNAGDRGQLRPSGTGFRPVSGEIISSDEKSITVKLQDGSSKIVVLSEKTEINQASEASREALKVGEKVAVFGAENSDGSVTAQNIQLNPLTRFAPEPKQ